MKDEVFKKVTVCANYSVSNYGQVRNDKRNTILSPRDLRGYKRVSLWYNKKANDQRIHRLVAQAFIPNPENKAEVNHKNGIRNDNRVSNLEWCTAEENVKHKVKTLNQGDTFKGINNGNSILTEADVLLIRASDSKPSVLSKHHKVSITQITRILNRKLWTHI
jgi:hypothetical protein